MWNWFSLCSRVCSRTVGNIMQEEHRFGGLVTAVVLEPRTFCKDGGYSLIIGRSKTDPLYFLADTCQECSSYRGDNDEDS